MKCWRENRKKRASFKFAQKVSKRAANKALLDWYSYAYIVCITCTLRKCLHGRIIHQKCFVSEQPSHTCHQQRPMHRNSIRSLRTFDQPNQAFKLAASGLIAHLTTKFTAKCHFCSSASRQHLSQTLLVMKPFQPHVSLGTSHFRVKVGKEKKVLS